MRPPRTLNTASSVPRRTWLTIWMSVIDDELIAIANIVAIMNISARTWEYFENGVSRPAELLSQFTKITDAEPHSLLTDKGRAILHSAHKIEPPCISG
jgi:hypothetical protein